MAFNQDINIQELSDEQAELINGGGLPGFRGIWPGLATYPLRVMLSNPELRARLLIPGSNPSKWTKT
jgi:hypothetical protein